MASLNPRRKTAESSRSMTTVTHRFWWCRKDGANGLETRCSAASAAERVMVMRKSVAAKPRRTSTRSLPHQAGSSLSSMRMEPSPVGDSRATRR